MKRAMVVAVLLSAALWSPGHGQEIVPLKGGPPPSAWMRLGDAGSVRMGRGTFCWIGTCADLFGPLKGQRLPRVQVPKGTPITFRFKFRLDDLSISRDNRPVERKRNFEQTPRKFKWTANRSGLYSVFVRDAKDKGDVSYQFKLRVW